MPRPGKRVPGRRRRLGEPDLGQHVAERRLGDDACRRDLVLPERLGQSRRQPHSNRDEEDEHDRSDEVAGPVAIVRRGVRAAWPSWTGAPGGRRKRHQPEGTCAIAGAARPAQRGSGPPRSRGSALENRSRTPAGTSPDPSEQGMIQGPWNCPGRKQPPASPEAPGVDGVPTRTPVRAPTGSGRLEQAGGRCCLRRDTWQRWSSPQLPRSPPSARSSWSPGRRRDRASERRRQAITYRRSTGSGFRGTSSSTARRPGATRTASSPSPSRS